MKELHKRILDISQEHQLSHIGSCLTAVDVIKEIYETKTPQDIFVLDEGHAALAYYVVLEHYGNQDAIKLFEKHGVHQNKDKEAGILVSAGSLGLAGSIALGLALGDPTRDVYCLTSDGALAEGIWWETLRVKTDKQISNLKVYVNANGFGAYDPIDLDTLEARLKAFCPDIQLRRTKIDDEILEEYPQLLGQDGHYKTIEKI